MSENGNYRSSGAGRSRARGSGSGRSSAGSSRSTSSRSSRGSSSRSSASRSGTGRSYRGTYGSSHSSRGGRRRGNQGPGIGKLILGVVLLIIAISVIVFLMKGMDGKAPKETEAEPETTTEQETELQKEVHVDGIDITGLSREDAKAAILKNYPWGMKVTWQGETYEVEDLMAAKVDGLLADIYAGEPKESYSLDTSGLEEAAGAEAAKAAAKWDKQPKNGSISAFDASSGKFTFAGAEEGRALDQEKLTADILAALGKKDFDAEIAAVVNPVQPEFSEATAREKYKTISTVTTNTTANSRRNTNVRLAAEAINGTVLQPGEEFSFNETVGQRTEAKGYKGAAAYNNGLVVEEIGGGVCQVSSTLYNAVLKAGLKTTVRRSHTFEPSYVTPGTDATISWGGPDYKFVNNSSAAIGIRASYADQKMTVSIYGIPILEEGVTYSLKSTKIKDLEVPAPTYEEDGTLEPGVEKVKSNGSAGSYWETRLVIKKDGEIVSQEVDHNTTYKGHAPVVLRNTSGTVAPTESSDGSGEASIAPSESPTFAPEGAGDGVNHTEGPGGTGSGQQPGGPGGSSAGQGSNSAGPGTGTTKPTEAATQPSTQAPSAPTQAPAAPSQPASAKPSEAAPSGQGSGVVPAPGGGETIPAQGGPAGTVEQTIAPMPGA